jgi:DNA-binding Lrp family transcriptional regulator
MALAHAFQLALLNPWQYGFPLVREPFARLAAELDLSVPELLAGYAALQREGALSRIGGVFAAGAGGAALLAAMTVPAQRLAEVAARVSAHPGVNHNYEREHARNLWFVMTGRDAAAVEVAMQGLEVATGLPALRLRLQRAYRIDLGFDLRQATATRPMRPSVDAAPVAEVDAPLAALVEAGLPLTEQPFDAWAQALGRRPEAVLGTLRQWLQAGTLRRFGTIVRHHELGFAANAMAVFAPPAGQVDAAGEALACEAGVTLAYRRTPAPGWPYTLYAMVHGRDRGAVAEVLQRVVARAGLAGCPQQVLFSLRRFKQEGARRFRDLPAADAPPSPYPPEVVHVEP